MMFERQETNEVNPMIALLTIPKVFKTQHRPEETQAEHKGLLQLRIWTRSLESL
jgi:hypothetical protein